NERLDSRMRTGRSALEQHIKVHKIRWQERHDVSEAGELFAADSVDRPEKRSRWRRNSEQSLDARIRVRITLELHRLEPLECNQLVVEFCAPHFRLATLANQSQ